MKVRHILQCVTFLCSARWVPKHLTEGYKSNCQHICNRKSDNFLNCIITGDETWVHHHEPESKWRSVQQRHKSSSFKKSKSHPSASMLLLTVFWDFQGTILEYCVDRGITVTSVNYCDILGSELRLTIWTKVRGRLS